uniref:Uncharacterized protein n=1 Tax=Chenopodium quinoa TaxID=63459 RepID=A0A803M9G3_CHEQI
MAATAASSFASSHQFLTNSPRTNLFFHPSTRSNATHLSFTPKAASEPDPEPESDPQSPSSDDDFDSRLSQMRLKYRSGTGKKAEIRKIKKGKQSDSGGTGKEPVDFGFSPYTERVNGRLAGVGLVALLLVELATGKSVISYHTPSIVFIQIYFMAAVSAVYLKFEKEKVSVWPQTDANK